MLRTRIYRAKWTPALDAALERCRYAQRAVYNRTIAEVPDQGGPVPAKLKSAAHPDGLYGRLTGWRRDEAWMRDMPVALQRPALSQARTALKLHEESVKTRTARLLDEEAAWSRWMQAHPDWDAGAWDALAVEHKREAAAHGGAPPKSACTWRDERGGDGARSGLFRRRNRSAGCAVVWDTPPRRVDASTVGLSGLGDVEVLARNPLPEAARLRSAKVCVKRGSRGRVRVEVHLAVRIDVVARTKRKPRVRQVAGADMGCAETLTMHDGESLALPDHDAAMEAVLEAQHAMSRCMRGSRQWRTALARLQREKAAMRARDRDAVRKAAKRLAARWDTLGIESLNISGMGASARGRAWSGVAAKRGLNRAIRAALWGFTQTTLANAFEARGGELLALPAMDSSGTCAACGHVDAASRDKRSFQCTRCGHTENADVNAAQVLRSRAVRWRELRGEGLTERETNEALWAQLRATRKACAGHAGARTKPARTATGAKRHNGGAGAPSTTLAEGIPTPQGDERLVGAGPEGGHEQRSV